GSKSSKQSRSEKKSRKAMLKLGMKPVTCVRRVTIERAKTILIGKGGAIISEMRSLTRANIRIIPTENLPRVASED
nr:nascent polypeptide-associated complex subunit alpha-like protein 2 [Tanacetum cinerariifolium]